MSRLLINKSAIARIAQVPVRKVSDYRVEGSKVFVLLRNGEILTLTVQQLEEEFARFRREAGKELAVIDVEETPYGQCWQVQGKTEHAYLVEQTESKLACSCEDWHQHEALCKHGWAVLHFMGCSSLAELWELQQSQGKEQASADLNHFLERVNNWLDEMIEPEQSGPRYERSGQRWCVRYGDRLIGVE